MIKIQIVACDMYVRYLYVYHPVIINIIGMYFSTKSYLKSTRNHMSKISAWFVYITEKHNS